MRCFFVFCFLFFFFFFVLFFLIFFIKAYKGICCGYSFELHRQVELHAIQMSIHNICLYKEVKKKYTGCNLKTTEFLDCALIGVCAVIRSNTVFFLCLSWGQQWTLCFFHHRAWSESNNFSVVCSELSKITRQCMHNSDVRKPTYLSLFKTEGFHLSMDLTVSIFKIFKHGFNSLDMQNGHSKMRWKPTIKIINPYHAE